jgi:hypothetical protein
MRAAERNAERQRRQYAREQMISNAGEAVADWQSRIRELISLHTHVAERIDWQGLATAPGPAAPEVTNEEERRAQAELDRFTPHWWDFLFGGSEKRQQKLVDAVVRGRSEDEINHRMAVEDHHRQVQEWETDRALAERLIAGDVKARMEVIEEMQSLSGEGLIGTDISFRLQEDCVHAIPHVHGDEIVPNVRRKQLQSGRLSETRMPMGEFNELYQDYVCSVALRIAGEMFALLPLDEVYVTCVATMLNSATGQQEDTPILSGRFVRETFDRLGLSRIDPSDSMRNFVHKMDFKRSRGFARIEALQPI